MMKVIIDTHIGMNEDGFTLLDLVSSVKRQGETENLTIEITSYGGDLMEARKITSYLESLQKSGIKIKTIAKGYCASASSRIFFAGDVRVFDNCDRFMIHNPWANIKGDAEYLGQISKHLTMLEKEESEYISKRININSEIIRSLMNVETYFTEQQAIDLGIITNGNKIEYKAVAYINDEYLKQMNKKETENRLENLLRRVENFLKGKADVNNLILTGANGEVIDFTELENVEEIEQGVKVIIDSNTDYTGEITTSDGIVHIIENGIYQGIKEKEEDIPLEIESKIDILENSLKDMEALNIKKENIIKEKEQEILNLTEEFKNFKNEVSLIQGQGVQTNSKEKKIETKLSLTEKFTKLK